MTLYTVIPVSDKNAGSNKNRHVRHGTAFSFFENDIHRTVRHLFLLK